VQAQGLISWVLARLRKTGGLLSGNRRTQTIDV